MNDRPEFTFGSLAAMAMYEKREQASPVEEAGAGMWAIAALGRQAESEMLARLTDDWIAPDDLAGTLEPADWSSAPSRRSASATHAQLPRGAGTRPSSGPRALTAGSCGLQARSNNCPPSVAWSCGPRSVCPSLSHM